MSGGEWPPRPAGVLKMMTRYRGKETLGVRLTCRMMRTMCSTTFEPLTQLFGCVAAAEQYAAERKRWIEPGTLKIETGKFTRKVSY